MKNKILIVGDHAGFALKEKLKCYLEEKYMIVDFGPLKYNKTDDYPDFVLPMARFLAKEKSKNVFGIIIAGSGQGEAIAVNKIKGIRAAIYHGGNPRIVRVTREHNDSNILCLGSRFVSEKEAKKAIDIFLKTKFSGEKRHKRRLRKLSNLGGK